MTKQFDLELILNELFGESVDEDVDDISIIGFPICPPVIDYVCCASTYTGYAD